MAARRGGWSLKSATALLSPLTFFFHISVLNVYETTAVKQSQAPCFTWHENATEHLSQRREATTPPQQDQLTAVFIIIIIIIIMFVYWRLSNATNTEQWHSIIA